MRYERFNRSEFRTKVTLLKALPHDTPLEQLDILYEDSRIKGTKKHRRYVLMKAIICSNGSSLPGIFYALPDGTKGRCLIEGKEMKYLKIEEISYVVRES